MLHLDVIPVWDAIKCVVLGFQKKNSYEEFGLTDFGGEFLVQEINLTSQRSTADSVRIILKKTSFV